MALKVLTFDSCGSQFLDDLKMSFMGDSRKGDQPTEGISNMDCSQKVDKTGICFHCSSEECVHNQNAKCDHNFKRITISELSSTNGGFGSSLDCNDEEDFLCASSKPDFMRTPFENRHTLVSNFVNQLNQIHLKKAGLCDAEKDRLLSFQEYPSTNHQGGILMQLQDKQKRMMKKKVVACTSQSLVLLGVAQWRIAQALLKTRVKLRE